MKYRVLRDWTASYGDPVRVAAGDPLILTGRRDSWEGHTWVWAVDPAGRGGWVPDTLPMAAAGGVVAARAFSAMELTCAAGDMLDGIEACHGWVLCRDDAGREGWVPKSHLTAMV